MKRILCLITLIISISFYSYSQIGNFRDITVRESLTLGDSTVTIIGKDTLTNPSMVRQLISEGAGYTASNGITKTGSDFQLGGSLTKRIDIQGNSYPFNLGTSSSNLGLFNLYVAGLIQLTGTQINLVLPTYTWSFSSNNITGSDGDYLVNNTRLVDYVEEQQKPTPFIFLYENIGVTTNVRPGIGYYSTNNATASLITEIYIDDYDQNIIDKHNFLQLADTGSYFYIQEKGITTAYYVYQIQSFDDSLGWTVYNVDYKFHVGNIPVSNNIELVLEPNNTTGSGAQYIDTIYISGQNIWVGKGDTVNYVDTSNYAFKGDSVNYADSSGYSFKSDSSNYSDTALFAINAIKDSSFVTITADTTKTSIISGSNLKLDLGTSKTSGAFYLGTTNPTNLTRLNWDGYLYATSIQASANNNTGMLASGSTAGVYGYTTTNRGVYGLAASTGYGGYFSSLSGMPLYATTAAGSTVSTQIASFQHKLANRFNFLVGGELQIYNNSAVLTYELNNDSLKAPNIIAEFKEVNAEKLISDTNIIDGDTITGGISLKDAIEAEQFTQLNYKDTTFTTRSEGRLFYNENTKNLIFENDISDFEHNIGYELVKRVYNNSGSTITNGSIVRRTGTYVNGSRVPTIGLAGNGSYDSARVCGMTTVDIPNNSYGIITIIGDVNFYNSSHLAENQFYLGHAGSTIDTSPPPPYYSVDLGCVIYSDNDSGIVAFNFRNPTFDPTPIISSDTSNWTESINLTQNIYTKFQISDFDLENDYGFTRLGDSIRCDVGGFVTIAMNTSYTGAVTSATWRKGIFLNGVNKHSVSRSTTSQAVGNSTVIKTLRVEVNDYISFRITNTTGNEDPTINDFSYQILYLHE